MWWGLAQLRVQPRSSRLRTAGVRSRGQRHGRGDQRCAREPGARHGPFRAVRSHRCQRQPIASGVRSQSRRGQGLLPRWQRPPHACHADQSGQQGHRGDQLVRHPLRLAHEREPSHLRGQQGRRGVLLGARRPGRALPRRRHQLHCCVSADQQRRHVTEPLPRARTRTDRRRIRERTHHRAAPGSGSSNCLRRGVRHRHRWRRQSDHVPGHGKSGGERKIHPRRTRAPHRSGRDRRGNERRKRRGRTGNPDLPRGHPKPHDRRPGRYGCSCASMASGCTGAQTRSRSGRPAATGRMGAERTQDPDPADRSVLHRRWPCGIHHRLRITSASNRRRGAWGSPRERHLPGIRELVLELLHHTTGIRFAAVRGRFDDVRSLHTAGLSAGVCRPCSRDARRHRTSSRPRSGRPVRVPTQLRTWRRLRRALAGNTIRRRNRPTRRHLTGWAGCRRVRHRPPQERHSPKRDLLRDPAQYRRILDTGRRRQRLVHQTALAPGREQRFRRAHHVGCSGRYSGGYVSSPTLRCVEGSG